MHLLKRLVKRQRGFTLVELAATTAIVAVLAATVTPAVVSTASSSRGGGKSSDVKNVESVVQRYQLDFNASPVATNTPTTTVYGAHGSATTTDPAGRTVNLIRIGIQTGDTRLTFSGSSSTVDVLCNTSANNSQAFATAVNKCLAQIDFSGSVTGHALTGTYISATPKHATGYAAPSTTALFTWDNSNATADDTFYNCTTIGEACRFYVFDAAGQSGTASFTAPSGSIFTWNADGGNNPVILRNDGDYGLSGVGGN